MARTHDSGVGAGDTEVPAASRFFDVGEVTLHAAVAGPEDGTPVVLLHGFPEFWYGWHRQIEPLVEAGFRVVVPDQRGYNRSDRPDGVRSYRIDALARDVAGLIDHVGSADPDAPADGEATAHVVGHDWGAFVGWWLALHRPERVRRLGVVNVPHPTVYRRTLRRRPDQALRSLYALFFQLPRVPEAVSRAGDWALPTRMMRATSRPGTFSTTDLERYRAAWRQPGAFESMLDWYRAAARERSRPRRTRVSPPTLVLWGVRDPFLRTSMAGDSVAFCDRGRLELLDATHWVQHEEPARVADELTAFLGGDGPPA